MYDSFSENTAHLILRRISCKVTARRLKEERRDHHGYRRAQEEDARVDEDSGSQSPETGDHPPDEGTTEADIKGPRLKRSRKLSTEARQDLGEGGGAGARNSTIVPIRPTGRKR